MTNSLTSKKDIVEALENAIESLRDSIEPIDRLNGFLYELDEIDKGTLSDRSHAILEEVHKFFVSLPVWDSIEDKISQLEEVMEEVKEKVTPASSKLLEELTESE